MNCSHWQVAVVPFPFMERPAAKRRPALVVSSRTFNAANDHTMMAMITTAKMERWPSDYAIANLEDAGLRTGCYVRWKIFTLPNSMIARTIGELADEDREALMVQARMIFVRP